MERRDNGLEKYKDITIFPTDPHICEDCGVTFLRHLRERNCLACFYKAHAAKENSHERIEPERKKKSGKR